MKGGEKMVKITNKPEKACLFNILYYKSKKRNEYKNITIFELTLGQGISTGLDLLENIIDLIRRIIRQLFVYKLILIKLCAANTKVKIPQFMFGY